MQRATRCSETITSDKLIKGYDIAFKNLISNKAILTWILKCCVDEFKDYDLELINSCIESTTIQKSNEPVHRPLSEKMISGDKTIIGSNTEDFSITEGTIYYDIKFNAVLPNTAKKVQLIINIEAQNNYNPGYSIKKRAIYYLSRLISAQYGTIFSNSEYNKICKVYSIWFCIAPLKKLQNSITEISLIEKGVYGDNTEIASSDIDLLKAVMVNLGSIDQNCDNMIINLFNLLLSSENIQKKKQLLENKYKIKMNEEVFDMCNIGKGVWNMAIEEGLEQGRKLGLEQGRKLGLEQGILIGEQKTLVNTYQIVTKLIQDAQHLSGDDLIKNVANALNVSFDVAKKFFNEHPEIKV